MYKHSYNNTTIFDEKIYVDIVGIGLGKDKYYIIVSLSTENWSWKKKELSRAPREGLRPAEGLKLD